MSSTITATYDSALKIIETFAGGYVSPGDNTATFDQLTENGTLTALTTPPVTKHADFQKAMTSGAATIDLTALPGKTADETVSGSGLKVQLMKLRSLSTNANKITVTKGASNGYGLDASGDTWTIPLSPGQSVLLWGDAANITIDGTHKTIDISGTGAQVLEISVVMG